MHEQEPKAGRRRRSSIGEASRFAGYWLLLFVGSAMSWGQSYFVDVAGDDEAGDGSAASPWGSIGGALARLHDDGVDGATVLVRPGEYVGRQNLVGTFSAGVTVRSEVPYQARLRHTSRVVTAYANGRGAQGITLEGFDLAHSGPGAAPLVFHIDGAGGNAGVGQLTIRDNVIHDSYDNDLLKINNGVTGVIVEGNMFYNQTGSDEHIDVNSVEDVIVRDNVFFNDFAGSGRTNNNDTSSYIVVKDSNGDDDQFVGNDRITIQRNVFLNWEGSTGSNFVLVGEDAKPYIEARNVLVENNLMLGNASNVMRAAFGVKSGENITFRNNTVSGDLPALAYAMRVNVENSLVTNDGIFFYNNIWSDPTGTMGSSFGGGNDFSDTPPDDTVNWSLRNNQYFNGGEALPTSPSELINYTDDPEGIIGHPGLSSLANLTLPRWDPTAAAFGDGSSTIREAFVRLVEQYGVPSSASLGVDAAADLFAPLDDILGNPRGGSPDVGAFEFSSGLSADIDGDRDVDGLDLLLVQRAGGALATAWQAELGDGVASSPRATTVLEPSSAALLLLLGAAGHGGRLRRQG